MISNKPNQGIQITKLAPIYLDEDESSSARQSFEVHANDEPSRKKSDALLSYQIEACATLHETKLILEQAQTRISYLELCIETNPSPIEDLNYTLEEDDETFYNFFNQQLKTASKPFVKYVHTLMNKINTMQNTIDDKISGYPECKLHLLVGGMKLVTAIEPSKLELEDLKIVQKDVENKQLKLANLIKTLENLEHSVSAQLCSSHTHRLVPEEGVRAHVKLSHPHQNHLVTPVQKNEPAVSAPKPRIPKH